MVKTTQIKELPSKLNRRMHRLVMFAVLFLVFFWGGCDRNKVFEANHDLPKYIWEADNELIFNVEIKDTAQLYNLLVNIRHSQILYTYSNIWLRVQVEDPESKQLINERFQISLAEKSGKWLGNCTGDICERQATFREEYKFKEKGDYTIHLQQIMREESLPAVMSAGFRIEKAELKAKE